MNIRKEFYKAYHTIRVINRYNLYRYRHRTLVYSVFTRLDKLNPVVITKAYIAITNRGSFR